VTLFQDIDPAARHVAVVSTEHGEREFVLDRTAPEIDLSGASSSTLHLFGRFIRAGIEHIFLGDDHIAFLLAVILWGRRLWPLVKVVTAFTLAHSLTLCLAVLDIVRLPSSLVEPLIAATIVFVAAENFFVHDIRKRWRATFVLGLVHAGIMACGHASIETRGNDRKPRKSSMRRRWWRPFVRGLRVP
jgi:hypothetical protein